MRRHFAVLLALSAAMAETPNTARKPVCGNTENGIVVGKPKLYDDRTLALLIDSLEGRLGKLKGASTDPVEQTQLLYQITNLKALLERALSDRVLLKPGSQGSQQAVHRALAVVGFQVSVDPGSKYAGAVAEVAITVASKGDSAKPAALSALYPKEKTYNVATLAKEPSGPLVEAVDGGKLYLVKDSDTVGLELLAPFREQPKACVTPSRESDRDLTFAWRFRPVLKRESVDPGAREVYALLALPTGTFEDYAADLRVHSHWRSLKKVKHKGASDVLDDSIRDDFWPDAIRYNPSEMESMLRPKVTEARFVYTGKDETMVIVDGEAFLPDTSVMIGNVTIAGDKLSIERERRLQFMAPAQLLTQYDLFLTGRFGVQAPLAEPQSLTPQWTSDPGWGLRIEHARARPKDFEISEVRIKIRSRQRKRPLAEMIVNKTLVSVAGRIYTVTSVDTDPTDSEALLMRFDVPTEAIRKSPRVNIARLFAGELFRDSAEVTLEDDITVSKVAVMSAFNEEVLLGIAGTGFSNLATVQISGTTYTRWTSPGLAVNGSTMITLKLKRSALAGAKQLAVMQGVAQPVILAMPELDAAKPVVKAAPPPPPRKPRRRE